MTTIFTLKNASFSAPGLPVLKTVDESFGSIASLKSWHQARQDLVTDNGTQYQLAAKNITGQPLYVESASAPAMASEIVNGVQVNYLNLVDKRLLWDGVIQGAGLAWTIVSAIRLTRPVAANEFLYRSLQSVDANNFAVYSSNGTGIRALFETNGPDFATQPTPNEWLLLKVGLTADGTLWMDINNGEFSKQTTGLSYVDCPQGLIVGGRYSANNNYGADIHLGEQFVFASDVRSLPEYSELNSYMTGKWLS